MSFPLRVRPEAAQDLEDAAVWYEEQSQGLGQRLLDELRKTLQRVAEHPELYPTVHRNTQRALTHRFPFGVFYRIEGDNIVVMAVLHGSRDPKRWKERT